MRILSFFGLFGLSLLFLSCSQIDKNDNPNVVIVLQGKLVGSLENQGEVRSFKGIPFAAPPVGDLRWQPPQAPQSWSGIRNAKSFGSKCMQNPLYSDMQFRDAGSSEDCLFLNVWAPASDSKKALPVLVYFYGGGFAAGDGSEKRYDGASMAAKGIVSVTVNYRMGVFGLFAHPQLSKESGYAGSGNYTFMDQAAALAWVKENIHAFGGDPNRVTIAGESAGSFSVSTLMASHLSRDLINGAIGESGSFLAGRLTSLQSAEANGVALVKAVLSDDVSGKEAIKQLKKLSAKALLDKVTEAKFRSFSGTIDNYVLPKHITQMYRDGEYAKVPFLAGNNSQEGGYTSVMKNMDVTVDNYKLAVQRQYPNSYEDMLELYPAATADEVMDAAQAIASDRFISLSTWNWINIVSQSNPDATYFYTYDHVRPLMKPEYWTKSWNQTLARGATHSAEIEYALGNLDVNNIYQWQQEDYKVSEMLQTYFVNFIKHGNPNGEGLVQWPEFKQRKQLIIKLEPIAENIDYLHKRYEGLNKLQ
ncbi:carboxylesterase/lipase family protein [Paraglaciecola sp. L3A3]|uniref:carboxylesterase/lipase family protein n=1 Tax=Paraglaciecola sp. L3A3 TaxID=2686358 RepID=UPI00131BB487|nr:carboxylesterase family protein [Paraglaciecola sp. L3A3]